MLQPNPPSLLQRTTSAVVPERLAQTPHVAFFDLHEIIILSYAAKSVVE